MLFIHAVAVLATLASALGARLPSRVQRSKGQLGRLAERQQLLDLTGCATLSANVPVTVNLTPLITSFTPTQDLCVCAVAGVLTPASLANIGVSLQSQTGLFLDLLSLLGTDSTIGLVGNALIPVLGDRLANDPNRCTYPVGAVPVCGTCDFTCAAPLVPCAGECRAAGSVCPSAAPITRRSLQRNLNPSLLCPAGLTACPVPSGLTRSTGKFECMDTKNNVETCGGCPFPLAGKPQGQDCSAIEAANDVSCVRGQCVIGSCKAGYVLVGKACVAA